MAHQKKKLPGSKEYSGCGDSGEGKKKWDSMKVIELGDLREVVKGGGGKTSGAITDMGTETGSKPPGKDIGQDP